MYSLIFPYAQVIAFVEALLRNENTNIRKVAIIVPVNTLENWKNEFMKWIPEDKRPQVNYHYTCYNILYCIYIDLSSCHD